MTRFVWLVPLSVALGFLTGPASAQQKLPTTAEVMGKLKEKRDRGGIQRYKLEFETTVLQSGKVLREDGDFQIDWKTGKFREAGVKKRGSEPFEITEVYDGEKIKTKFRYLTEDGKPVGDGAWKYGMLTGRPNSWRFQAEWWPVFFHQGVVVGLNDGFYPTHFVFDADAETFFVNAEVDRNGRKCISLKTFPERQMEYEYIIDPKKDYSVVAFTYTRGNVPVYTHDIDVVEAKKPGRWAVRGWTRTYSNGKGGAEIVTKVKVTDFDEDVKVGEDNKFDIVPPEGATVGRSHYVLTRNARGEQDITLIPYKYVVKNGKLVQTEGPAMTPEMWVYDHRRLIARTLFLPIAAWVRRGLPCRVPRQW